MAAERGCGNAGNAGVRSVYKFDGACWAAGFAVMGRKERTHVLVDPLFLILGARNDRCAIPAFGKREPPQSLRLQHARRSR